MYFSIAASSPVIQAFIIASVSPPVKADLISIQARCKAPSGPPPEVSVDFPNLLIWFCNSTINKARSRAYSRKSVFMAGFSTCSAASVYPSFPSLRIEINPSKVLIVSVVVSSVCIMTNSF
ncbi:hypothetical protein D3C80_1917630 [compost metagenome]